MNKYKCSLDLYAQLKRLAFIVPLLYILIFQSIGLFVAAFIFCAILYLATPSNIKVDNDVMDIEGSIRSLETINFADITSIKAVAGMGYNFKGTAYGAQNFLTSFAHTGSRYNSFIGDAKWYCSQLKNYVIIETEKNKFVISPDDPTALIADIKRRHPSIVSKEEL